MPWKGAWLTFGLDVSKIGVIVTNGWHVGPSATSCDTMVAKYDATKWPIVLIRTKINVLQQRMHLRYAMKGVCAISPRFVDSDSELSLNCSVSVFFVCWQKFFKCIFWLHKTRRTCANKPNASSIAAQTLPPWLELCRAALLKAHSRSESRNVSCHCISEKVRFLGYVFTIQKFTTPLL